MFRFSSSRPRSSATAAGTLQTPEQFLGFKVGADNKLVRWDKIVDYMKLAAANSDRVRFRELGKTSDNNPFIALEISSPDTLKNLCWSPGARPNEVSVNQGIDFTVQSDVVQCLRVRQHR